MQHRRIARELALLGLNQLPATPAKLETKQLEDLLLAAVRTLQEEAKDALTAAGDEVRRGHRLLQTSLVDLPEGDLESEAQVALQRVEQFQKQLQRITTGIRTSNDARLAQQEMLGFAVQLKTLLAQASEQFTGLEQRLQTVRQMLQESVKLSESAINRVGGSLTLPEFVAISQMDPVRSYALELLTTVHQHRAHVDGRIEAALVGWQMNRLARLDRDVMRLAVAEVEFLHLPDRVAINEAVELAKHYGGDESPSFINGILRRVMEAVSASARAQV